MAYKNGYSETGNVYRQNCYICKNGGVWVLGHGDNSSNGEQGRSSSYFREMTFRWRDFWNSENRNEGGFEERRGRKTTRYDRMRTLDVFRLKKDTVTNYYYLITDKYFTGYGSHGQQGTGYDGSPGMSMTTDGLEDVFVLKLYKQEVVKQIHIPCLLDDNGDVWTWGYNGYGEVGDGRTQNAYGLKRMQENGLMTRSCRYYLALVTERLCSMQEQVKIIFTWGRNNIGQLGDTTTTDRYGLLKCKVSMLLITVVSLYGKLILTHLTLLSTY